jgi:GntR family transcriptional repressor for pyruvate dehydrogenase complex
MVGLQLVPPRKARLADILYGQILEQILASTFKEGDRLPTEHEISASFNVSRPVVREALSRLQADGLVYSRRGAGTFIRAIPSSAITEFTPADKISSYLKSFDVRFALEAAAAQLAAERRTPANMSSIKAAMEQLETKLSQGGPASLEDFAFHREIAIASGNDLFVTLFDSIHEVVEGWITMASGLTQRGTAERRKAVLSEHADIVRAIEGGNGEAAALYMRYHLAQARERVTDSNWSARLGAT